MVQAEVVAVGNELLLGDVLDTNSHWLCCQLTGLGGGVRRVVQVRDDLEAIVSEVRRALERSTDLLLTSGGMGPTDDDLTLPAVAQALGRPLLEHPQALTIVAQRYRELAEQGHVADATLTPARRKMAQLPAGAEPLFNPVGTAPAVLLRQGKTLLVCLPGVPAELKAIFAGPLTPLLQELFGAGSYAEWTVVTNCGDESRLAPLLRQIVAGHPDVYVKSRAQQFGSDVRLRVTLSLAGGAAEEVQAGLHAALKDLLVALAQAGIAAEKVEQG